ncbi:hypothetical protein ABT381_25630 [Streptomyces sp. NPDC000151]|uniref:hypothetical protein n=1 Tax=Streptomyces sp. NPDC000151 TaxID=3154244 RepID=UPI003330A51D
MLFEVWAPDAGRVELVREDRAAPMTRCPSRTGWWRAEVAARHGDRYAFRLDGGEIGRASGRERV